jgi:hypothetical protein
MPVPSFPFFCAVQLRALQEQATKSAKGMMDAYFSRIKRLSESDKLESRLRFMLLDVIEQRARGWETRRKKEGPKKIEVGAAGSVWLGLWYSAMVSVGCASTGTPKLEVVPVGLPACLQHWDALQHWLPLTLSL